MEIKEAQKRLDQAKTEISETIDQFEKDTDLRINSVSIRKISHVGDGKVLKIVTLVDLGIDFDDFSEME